MLEIMPLTTWLTFAGASAILIAIPGPVVTFVIACSITHGTRAGLTGVAGTTVGTGLLLAACGLGLIPLLAALADWFDVLRLAGAGYLIWLGIQQWRADPVVMTPDMMARSGHRRRSILGQAFLIAITNPKSIVFFAAFLPQFMDPALPVGPQLLILSVTFMVLGALLDGMWAVLGGRVRHLFRTPASVRLRNRIAGSFLMLTGLAMALTRRTA